MAKRILIVDDDLYIKELYEEILKDASYSVDTAADGMEALAKLRVGGYDLVLLDIMMPKMDGFGILDTLKNETPQTKNGPILLLTNLDHGPLIHEGIKKGASAFLIKADLTPNELVNQVKKYLPD